MAQNTVIRTNVLAINAHRNLGLVGTTQARSSQRLSSGYRINSAADDAAGLAISEKMRAQIRGLDQADRNTQDAISLIQTAEGGMQEIDNMVQRIRELVVYASNDHLEYADGPGGSAEGDRQKIQNEINQLMQEIDSMASRVEFNRKRLIDGSFSAASTPLGSGVALQQALAAAQIASDGLAANISAADAAARATSAALTSALGVSANVPSGTVDGAFSGAISAANATISDLVSGLATRETAGAFDLISAEIESIIRGLEETHSLLPSGASGADALLSAIGQLRAGVASAGFRGLRGMHQAQVAARTNHTMLAAQTSAATEAVSAAQTAFNEFADSFYPDDWRTFESPAANTLWFQLGANAGQGMHLNINGVTTVELFGAAGNLHLRDAVTVGAIDSTIDVVQATGNSGEVGAGNAGITRLLDLMDSAAAKVATERGRLGAAQNRLEFTSNSLQISSENLQAAESRVRNTDMGAEMMRLTQANILQQAAISMLAQANMQPQSVLQLLG